MGTTQISVKLTIPKKRFWWIISPLNISLTSIKGKPSNYGKLTVNFNSEVTYSTDHTDLTLLKSSWSILAGFSSIVGSKILYQFNTVSFWR